MDIDIAHDYPCDVETAFAALGSAEMIRARAAALDHRELEIIACGTESSGYRIHYLRSVPVTVPPSAAKLIAPRTTVEQHDLWTDHDVAADTRRGAWWVRAHGIPVEMSGEMSLEPSTDGCRHHITGTMRVKIPVLGSTIKRFLLGDTHRAIADEAAYVVEWIEGRR